MPLPPFTLPCVADLSVLTLVPMLSQSFDAGLPIFKSKVLVPLSIMVA